MRKLTRDGKSVPYEILPTKSKKAYYTSFVQDGVLHFYVPEGTSDQTARDVLGQRFYDYYYKIHPEEWHVVHYLGQVYHAELRVGKKTGVTIEGDRMIVRAAKESRHAYRCVLLAFFKRTVEKELTRLIYDAEYAFREITFPTISVKTVHGYWGYNYKREIVLSPQIARYDPRYLRALLYHELCHSLVRGHGEDFWALFAKKCPEGRALGEERNALAYDVKDYL
ncbi:MAG: M48 family metallopeptidase [Clostridia bacterium]|nr:M48 family metallopeptidase [Clostridia bacterium]